MHYKTPNFNLLGKDHHWLVAQQPPLKQDQKAWIDHSEYDSCPCTSYKPALLHINNIKGGIRCLFLLFSVPQLELETALICSLS